MSEVKVAKRTCKKRLTEGKWSEIRDLWARGDYTLNELADTYHLTTRAIQFHLSKHKVIKGEKAIATAVAVREKMAIDDVAEITDLAALAKDARRSAHSNAMKLEKLLMSQIELGISDPASSFKIASTIKSLSLATAALERIFDIKAKALGQFAFAPDENELPGIVIDDLTEDELAQIRSANEEELIE